ncbi:7417_t:CDS:1, partial [Funneliformis geosporum]
ERNQESNLFRFIMTLSRYWKLFWNFLNRFQLQLKMNLHELAEKAEKDI